MHSVSIYCMLLHLFLGETEAILIASFALSVPLPIAASLTSAKGNVKFNCSYYSLGSEHVNRVFFLSLGATVQYAK